MEYTVVTSMAPALALLTTGVSGQLQSSPKSSVRLGMANLIPCPPEEPKS